MTPHDVLSRLPWFRKQSRVIGSGSVREMQVRDADAGVMQTSAYMSDLKVLPSWRTKMVRVGGKRCSLAVEIMRECERQAASWGYTHTYLKVYQTNVKAAKLYTSKLGCATRATMQEASSHLPHPRLYAT